MVLKNFCLSSLRRAFERSPPCASWACNSKTMLLLWPERSVSHKQCMQGVKTSKKDPLQGALGVGLLVLMTSVHCGSAPGALQVLWGRRGFARGGLPLLCLFPTCWSSAGLPAAVRCLVCHSHRAHLERRKMSSCLSEPSPSAVCKILEANNLGNKQNTAPPPCCKHSEPRFPCLLSAAVSD